VPGQQYQQNTNVAKSPVRPNTVPSVIATIWSPLSPLPSPSPGPPGPPGPPPASPPPPSKSQPASSKPPSSAGRGDLLSQIRSGTKLKKVDDTEKHIADDPLATGSNSTANASHGGPSKGGPRGKPAADPTDLTSQLQALMAKRRAVVKEDNHPKETTNEEDW